MKIIKLIGVLGVVLGCAMPVSAQATKSRLFLQVELDQNAEYRRVWSQKLEVTPFDCGRYVRSACFDPELSVSIYSYQRADGSLGFRATYIVCLQNIWQASDGIKDHGKALAVKSRRYDAEMTPKTALLLRRAWTPCFETLTRGNLKSSIRGY